MAAAASAMAAAASAMAANDTSHTTLLFYTKCIHTILIPVITYWCVLINVSSLTAVFWALP